jgi:hypothetical protein
MSLGLAATSALAAEPAQNPPTSAKEFVVEVPAGIDSARSVFLVLTDVRLPRKAAVVLRARLVENAGDTAELPLGSVGLLAESKDADGVAEHGFVRIEVSKRLKRWRQEHRDVGTIRIRVVPYAGARSLPDFEWSAVSAQLSLAGS